MSDSRTTRPDRWSIDFDRLVGGQDGFAGAAARDGGADCCRDFPAGELCCGH
ncbi:MAG: hypothetical protein ACOX1P_18355 [Thermoguttaceae bacterium]